MNPVPDGGFTVQAVATHRTMIRKRSQPRGGRLKSAPSPASTSSTCFNSAEAALKMSTSTAQASAKIFG